MYVGAGLVAGLTMCTQEHVEVILMHGETNWQASKLFSRNNMTTQVPKQAQPNTPVASRVGKGWRRGWDVCPDR